MKKMKRKRNSHLRFDIGFLKTNKIKLLSEATSLFDVQRSMFDVRCSSFICLQGVDFSLNYFESEFILRSGFKTSPQAQFLCWAEGFNTQNITYIPAFESLAPP